MTSLLNYSHRLYYRLQCFKIPGIGFDEHDTTCMRAGGGGYSSEKDLNNGVCGSGNERSPRISFVNEKRIQDARRNTVIVERKTGSIVYGKLVSLRGYRQPALSAVVEHQCQTPRP